MTVLASILLASALAGEPFVSKDASAAELVKACRTMIPANVELTGRIVLRNRKGIPQAEHDYGLSRSNSVTRLVIDGQPYDPPSQPSQPSQPLNLSTTILGTDVTWSDLTLDYLWWDDFSFDTTREGETVHGQTCAVVVLKKGERVVRVWVDRKTGAMMQAEEFAGEKPVRRLWGTRIRKFGERWMANVLEVETVGSGHRTKITVETLK